MKKKLLQLTLALTLSLSLIVPASAHGHYFSDHAAIHHKEAVSRCADLSILNGYTDGSFQPEGAVTRAEFCKIMSATVNGGQAPASVPGGTSFSDVSSSAWYREHVAYCSSIGLINGVGNGRFDPAGNVTGMQAAKMLLVAMGYNGEQYGFTGPNWAYNVNRWAEKEDLFQDLTGLNKDAALSRDDTAQMLANAMDADPDLYGGRQDSGVSSLPVTVTQKNIVYPIPGRSYAYTLHYDLVSVQDSGAVAHAINRTIYQDFAAFSQGTGRHELLGKWLGWSAKETEPYPESFFPAEVSAEVVYQQNGVLSILFQSHYIYDHFSSYGMTFDLKTGQLLTAETFSDLTEAQLLRLYRSKLPDVVGSPGESWEYDCVYWDTMTLADLEFVIDRGELVFYSPEVQYPDGTLMNFEVRSGLYWNG